MQTFLDSTDKTELEGKIQENSEAINKLKDVLLDTPVTIPAGEVGRITYTITIPKPYTV